MRGENRHQKTANYRPGVFGTVEEGFWLDDWLDD